ncbi:MAG: PIN/TRAM domain-containing protein [Candidatus Saccharimonadaceae bacterium]
MELYIIIVLLAIAAETTFLVVKSLRKERMAILAPVFVDTSVLIDGRIIAIAESGFLTRPLYIPRSVVGELQFLADNGDTEKRTRARHGLDIISQLQAMPLMKTVIFPDGVKAEEGVDNRLLMLAKKHSGSLCTIDYNLNKVAVVEGIEVLNVNELAKSLRMAYLPGEHGFIELTQKGNDQHQAVGHLEDGTMVVVEHAFKQIGTTVEVEFIRSLQTAAGKMMFAKLAQPNVQPKRATASRSAESDSKPRQQKPKGTAPTNQKAPRQAAPRAPREVRSRFDSVAEQSEENQNQPTEIESKPKYANSRQSRRPRSPEDSLMDLVNNQE